MQTPIENVKVYMDHAGSNDGEVGIGFISSGSKYYRHRTSCIYRYTFTLLFWIQTVSIIACVAGWITLNTKYLSPDGKTSDTHRYGTLVFMIGMISYFVCLLYCIKSFLINVSRDVIGTMIAYLIAVLLVVTFVLGILFIVGLFNSESNAWMFEHSAFMTIVLAHIAFFSLESPDPWLPFSIEDPQYQRIQETETSGLNPRIAPSDLPRMSVKGV